MAINQGINIEAKVTGVERTEKLARALDMVAKHSEKNKKTRLSSYFNQNEKALSRVNREMQRNLVLQQQSGKSTRRMELGFQQAGYQFQDLVVQLQGGVNPFVAISQQGSQLASFFAGPWGASIGLAIAALGALGTAFMATREEVKELSESFDDLGKAQQKAEKLTENLARSQVDMVAKYGLLADKVREYNVEVAKKSISDIEDFFDATEKKVTKTAKKLGRAISSDIFKGFDIQKEGENFFGIDIYSEEQEAGLKRLRLYLEMLSKAKGPKEQYEMLLLVRSQVKDLGGDFEKVFGKDAVGEIADYNTQLTEAEDALKNLTAATKGMSRDTGNMLLLLETGLITIKDLMPPIEDGMFKTKEEAKSLADAFKDAAKEAREIAKAVDKFYDKMRSEQSTVAGLKAQLEVLKSGGTQYEARAAGAGTSLREDLMKDPVTQEILRTGSAGEVATLLKNIESRVSTVEQKELLKGQISALTGGSRKAEQKGDQYEEFLRKQRAELELKKKNVLLTDEVIARNEYEFKLRDKAEQLKVSVNEEEMNRLMALYDQTVKLGQQRQIMDSVQDNVENMLMTIVDGTSSIEDAFKSMLRSIILEIYQQMVARQAASFITSMIFGAANGAVMSRGNVTPFASGGVVNGPTLFPMSNGTGLMGEAGPEAIMPLKRGKDGKLGVEGGSTTIVQNINVSTGVQQTVRTEIKSLMPQIADAAKGAVVDAKRRGGSYGRVFN